MNSQHNERELHAKRARISKRQTDGVLIGNDYRYVRRSGERRSAVHSEHESQKSSFYCVKLG